MKTWSYGINGHPDWSFGTIHLEDRPWWVAFVEWFALWVDWAWLRKIPLPDWPQIAWADNGGERCSPQEWWGDVGGLVNCEVTNPLYQWAWAHPRNKRTEVKLSYERIREIFYTDNPEMFDEEDERFDIKRIES